MKLQITIPSALLAILTVVTYSGIAEAARQPANSVLLKNVQSLTLRKDRKTSHRRVSAIPQLTCVGGTGCGHYEIDVMRCSNSGTGYDNDDVEWTCKAAVPPEFKLGSTDVICEGYSNPDDPYILKGSCGVEYRLALTEQGEGKYGRKSSWGGKSTSGTHDSDPHAYSAMDKFVSNVFGLLFIGVALWMVFTFLKNYLTNNNQPGNAPRRPGGFGGGYGGGGGGGDDDDPPPPYDYRPPGTGSPFTRKTSSTTPSGGQQGWRPGFWSGAAGGAAAGYAAGQYNRDRNQTRNNNPVYGGGGGNSWFGGNAGEGSSGTGGRSGGSSSPPSTSRYESTGFGSTRRR